MATVQKKRFSVTLDVDDYDALKSIAKNQKPPMSLQYVVAFALSGFIASQKMRQIELNFKKESN